METTPKRKTRTRVLLKNITINIICYSFALLYLYAATNKLIAFDDLQLQMSKSPIITDFAPFLVWFVPALEILIAMLFFIGLFIERTILLGLYAAFTLMCFFTVYIVAIISFSDSVPCSCGGIIEEFSWQEHLVFNVVFIVLGVVGIVLQKKF
ncbi:putative membrane protein YphA (DoxX/SURF4 family) [Pedobacter sp. AK017]|uniref:MauE/DoxX family redox-associated membrane protein n=1 Tax=Pedobacter sp. AK017 TaxID=2723073 RepID=UPI0016194A5F|nr:MauE/DoxX family redox-associated membrane protein [Pedobacter sp. AK017]MBB5438141.1 putative membrane protein YphA (DoxX/SURF4 family) [Pedobacter sp. AK017]